MRKIKDCKEIKKNIIACKTADDEIVLFGTLDEIFDISGADDIQRYYEDTYVLGYRDSEGEIWYGGADPSAYINHISHLGYIDEKGISHNWKEVIGTHKLLDKIIKDNGEESIYVWRPDYEVVNIAQILSRNEKAVDTAIKLKKLFERGGTKE